MSIKELKELQKRMIETNNKYNKIVIIIILLCLLISCLIIYKCKLEVLFIIPFMMVFLVLTIIIEVVIKGPKINKDYDLFNKEYKRIFVYSALNKIFDELEYDYQSGIEKSVIEKTNMMTTGDIYNSNDFISGKYHEIPFVQSDVEIEEEYEVTDSEGNTTAYTETVFKGRWMIFDFNKEFKANIQVYSNGFVAANDYEGNNFKKIQMEDSNFNKIFSVYAQDEHDAFYILTPHFMEKIKEINSKLGGSIMLCFIDNKLHIAINNDEDSFEIDVFKEINEKEIENSILKDIKLITDLIDYLRLDNDLFRREV